MTTTKPASVVEALRKIAATRYGFQTIVEDYPDPNAYNYHAMNYWAKTANEYCAMARAALPFAEQQERAFATMLEALVHARRCMGNSPATFEHDLPVIDRAIALAEQEGE